MNLNSDDQNLTEVQSRSNSDSQTEKSMEIDDHQSDVESKSLELGLTPVKREKTPEKLASIETEEYLLIPKSPFEC